MVHQRVEQREAAGAAALYDQPRRVCQPARDQRLRAFDRILQVDPAPLALERVAIRPSVARTAAIVDREKAVAAAGEEICFEVEGVKNLGGRSAVDVDDHRWGSLSLKIGIGGRIVEPVHRDPIRGLPGNRFGLAEELHGQHVALTARDHFGLTARNAQDARRFGGGLGDQRQLTGRRDAGLLDMGVRGGVNFRYLSGVQVDTSEVGLPELILDEI